MGQRGRNAPGELEAEIIDGTVVLKEDAGGRRDARSSGTGQDDARRHGDAFREEGVWFDFGPGGWSRGTWRAGTANAGASGGVLGTVGQRIVIGIGLAFAAMMALSFAVVVGVFIGAKVLLTKLTSGMGDRRPVRRP